MSAQQRGPGPATPAAGRPDSLKPLRFSTSGIASTNRVPLWEHHNARALISLDIRTLDDAPLEACELNLNFPALRFAHVKGSAQIVERSQRYIRDHRTDVVAVFFALEGDAFFHHPGGHEFLGPGQAIMYDADLPFMRGFCSGLQELVLTIPRSYYLQLSGGKPLRKPIMFDFNRGASVNHHALALAKLVSATLRHSEADPDQVEQSALELLRLLISGGSEAGCGYLAAAKAYIDLHLRDPDLSAPEVAAAVGISERHLARIFAEAGLAPSRFILDERLNLARDTLTDPAAATTPIGQLAAELGFASQTYFARAFKCRFGVTPLQLRKDAAAGQLL
jgi:AraC-like DNA-binding protein